MQPAECFSEVVVRIAPLISDELLTKKVTSERMLVASIGFIHNNSLRVKCMRMESSYLVDPASSHMLVSKIKPCMSKYKPIIR